eukprot:g3452.t1
MNKRAANVVPKLKPNEFYNARRYLHDRTQMESVFSALEPLLPSLAEAGKMQKDNTGSKGGSSPTATGLHVLSIGGTNAEFDIRLATALCGRRKYVIYTVAETSEAYREHIEEIMQNDIVQELVNSRRLQFRDETSRRPRVHRLTDLVIFNNCLHLTATSSPSPEKIVIETLLNACSPDANVIIFQQGSSSGFLHVRKRLDFQFPLSLGRVELSDVQLTRNLEEMAKNRNEKLLIEHLQIDTSIDVSDCMQRTREGLEILNGALAGKISDDPSMLEITLEAMEECCVSKYGDDGDYFDAPLGMIILKRDVDFFIEQLRMSAEENNRLDSKYSNLLDNNNNVGNSKSGEREEGVNNNGEWVNERLAYWHKQRAAWRKPKGTRRPPPKAVPYEQVVEGLATLQREFQLPGWISLPDLIDLYVEIWDMDY